MCFNCHNCKGLKYLIRLCLGLIYLPEDKSKHTFQDTLNPFCLCDLDIETNLYFFTLLPLFSNQRCTLLSTVSDTDI